MKPQASVQWFSHHLMGVFALCAVIAVACAPAAQPAAPAAQPAKPAAEPAKPAAPAPAPAAAPAKPIEPAKPAQPAKPAAPAKAVELALGTGPSGGGFYPLGGAMAKIWADTDPNLKVTVQATGGSVANIRLLRRSEVQLGLAQNDVSFYAFTGTEMFTDGKADIRAIAAIYAEYVQMVVWADSGIKQVADLKGKRFTPGPAGSGAMTHAQQSLEAAGLKPTDLAAWQLLSVSEQMAALKDRRVDGLSFSFPFPAWQVQDLALLREVRLLPIGGELRDKLLTKYKFYSPSTIPKNTYRGQTEDVPTVGVQALLLASPDLAQDAAYRLTKILIEKQSALAQADAKGKELNAKNAASDPSIPLHPGAEKYYREIGVLK